MSNGIGMIIDGLVAFLLVLTIGYCMMLNRRLKLLKADEQSLRATISELVTATEIAERAIGGLKLTVHECDMGLGERLRKAERVTIEIDRAIVAGKDLLSAAVADRRPPGGQPTNRSCRSPRRGAATPRPSRRRRKPSPKAAHEGARSRGMIRYIRDLRLIPIALIASACLLALKTADLVIAQLLFLRRQQCAGRATAM